LGDAAAPVAAPTVVAAGTQGQDLVDTQNSQGAQAIENDFTAVGLPSSRVLPAAVQDNRDAVGLLPSRHRPTAGPIAPGPAPKSSVSSIEIYGGIAVLALAAFLIMRHK